MPETLLNNGLSGGGEPPDDAPQNEAGAQGTSASGGGAAGGSSDPWYAGIPEDLLTEKVKTFADVSELVKSYNNAESLVGKKALTFGEDATWEDLSPEQRGQLALAMGVPESPDKYDFAPDDGFPLDDEGLKAVKERMHKLGLTNTQFGELMNMFAESTGQLTQQTEQQRAEAQATEAADTFLALQNEWGGEDKAKERLKRVGTVAKELGVLEDLKAAGLGNNLNVIKMFDKIANGMSESTIRDGDVTGPVLGVQSQLAKLRKSEAFWDAGHPQHEATVRRIVELEKQAANE